jgi:eukaryotic-like serine/threonine-protein kinase
MRGGSSLAVLAEALRSALGIRESDPLAQQQEQVAAGVELRVDPLECERVTFFLGELVGATFSDDDRPSLQAARRDSQIMADQMRRAWIDFLAAACKRRPVVLMLEDLHWGDTSSVAFIDAALDACRDAPWMVLALGRPEVQATFPELWTRRRFHQVRLGPLTRRACEQLAWHALGDEIGPQTVARIAERSDGNAFYLEELIRAVSRGQAQALPETVLAMVQARLRAVSPTQRRVLRAASVFGEVFWTGGVRALAGAGADHEIDEVIDELTVAELVEPCGVSRLRGETQLRFRHALLREGAYAMLTDADLELGHRLAAQWLERAGEADALSLAEHFRLGGEPTRASAFYLRAAEQALRAADTAGVLRTAQLGLEGASEPTRLALLGLTCEAHFWRMELTQAASIGAQVMSLEPPGSASWMRGSAAVLVHALTCGDIPTFMTTLQALLTTDVAPDAIGAAAYGIATSAACLLVTGQFEAAEPSLRRLRELVEPIAQREPIGRGWMHIVPGVRALWLNEDPQQGLWHGRLASDSFREAGHRRGMLLAEVYSGMNLWALGRLEEAEATLRATLDADEELALASSGRTFYLVGVLADAGKLDAATEQARRMSEVGRTRGPVDQGRGHWALAETLRRGSALEEAEVEARAALECLTAGYLPLDCMAAMGTLAAIQLARGDATALDTIRAALEHYRNYGAWGFRGNFARLVHAEALEAFGSREEARAALADAAHQLRQQVERIRDPEHARAFLEDVPEHARTLELAAAAGV